MNDAPIAVNAPASPKLNAKTNIKPKPILFNAIAPNITISAEGRVFLKREHLRLIIASFNCLQWLGSLSRLREPRQIAKQKNTG